MSKLDDYKKIMTDLRGGKFKPVYVLHGEEGFFIDRIASEVERLALEEQRDFNQTILYGRDCDPDAVKDTCLRFPMMAERQLVVVRELQNWRIDQVEKLENFLLLFGWNVPDNIAPVLKNLRIFPVREAGMLDKCDTAITYEILPTEGLYILNTADFIQASGSIAFRFRDR